jgi:hypothetical protein
MRLTYSSTDEIPPQNIHVGDLVDIAFSVIGVEGNSLKKGGRPVLVLRSVTLLDDTHTAVSIPKHVDK